MARNRWRITITFPPDWPHEPSLAGTTHTLWYRTEDMALTALTGFRLRGAIC